MKVCMVIPPRVDGQWLGREDKHTAVHIKETPPYTAPLLYALIKEHIPTVQLELIEAQRDDLTVEQVMAKLYEINPDIVISFMSWTHIPWDRVCAESEYPTIAVVLQQYIDQREAVELYDLKSQYYVKQELEIPIVEALKEFEACGDIINTKGFIMQRNGILHDTGDAPLADITRFPLPAFEVFKPEKYFALRQINPTVADNHVKAAYFNTMKGCPYKCAYCGQANKGHKVRYQSVEQVINQIEYYYYNYDVKYFVFFDNEFAINLVRAKEICKEIISRRIDIRYIINNRVELFDDELIMLLKRSGCDTVKLGIETCDPVLQEYVNKRINLNDAKRVIKQVKNAGIKVHLYMTTGIPGETRRSLRMNARFIADVDADNFTCGALFLMPNSPIYNNMKNSGKLLETDWVEYRARRKLCYVNESYLTMREVIRAENYLERRAHLNIFLKHLSNGHLNMMSFARSIMTKSQLIGLYSYIPSPFKKGIVNRLKKNSLRSNYAD